MKKYLFLISATVIFGALFLLSCEKEEIVEKSIVSTTVISDITANSAASGGNVTDDGGGEITARGVCWNTAGSPTTADDKSNNGNGTGSFTSQLTGLTAGTSYYVRSYSTNSEGTSFGNEQTFDTKSGIPTLTTTEITDITANSAASGGDITDNGGADITERGVCWNTTGSPTIADDKTTDGTGTGSFASQLTELTAGTEYFVRAYAKTASGVEYGNEIIFSALISCEDFTDSRDDKTYKTVLIGDQCWMAENLNMGTRINGVDDQTDNGTIEKYCYDNDESNCDVYGGLYQWDEVMGYSSSSDTNPSGVNGICPDGWHVPSDTEWQKMEVYLGISETYANETGWRGGTEGGMLKESGLTHWNTPNEGATNSSNFSALPSGYWSVISFGAIGNDTYYWTTTESSNSDAWYRGLSYYYSTIYRIDTGNKNNGYAVRCVKD